MYITKTNTTANNVVTINTNTNVANTTATVTSNSYTGSSTITDLNSAANGSRKYYSFTPPSLAAPTSPVTFSAITATDSKAPTPKRIPRKNKILLNSILDRA